MVLSFATVAYAVAAFLPFFWRSFATSVSTERAWVLWVTANGPFVQIPGVVFSSETTPNSAHDTRQECEKVKVQTMNSWGLDTAKSLSRDMRTRSLGDTACLEQKGPDGAWQKHTTYFYVCLPDSVDPRGPKR